MDGPENTRGLRPRRFVGGDRAFGRDLAAPVVVPDGATPVQVAAALAQHRLIAQLRGRAGPGQLTAEALGMSQSTFERFRDGRKEATIEDLFAAAAAAGLDLLDLMSPADTLMPPGGPAIDPIWVAGRWEQPSFAPKPTRLEHLNWAAVARAAAATARTAIASGVAAVLVGDVLAYHLLPTLYGQGLPAGTAGSTRDSRYDVPGVVFDLPHAALLAVAVELAANDGDAARRAVRRVVRLLYAAAPADEAMAVLVMSADVRARVVAIAPQLDGTPEQPYTVSYTKARAHLDDAYRDLSGVVRARVVDGAITVVIVSVEKADGIDDNARASADTGST